MLDFLKEKMPTDSQAFDVPKVGISDIVNGLLDLKRYSKKFNCRWMTENKFPGTAAMVYCEEIFGLIEILPDWHFQTPLALVVKDCPNFIGECLPSEIKSLQVINCPMFSGKRLPEIEVGILIIQSCDRINFAKFPLPKRLGCLLVYRPVDFPNQIQWASDKNILVLTKKMRQEGFEVYEKEDVIEYTNPLESKMYQM
ncbi:hypothetical protein A28LD_2022 [Idiomarina sp. A28L]|uniref:hypothetical protein n=1 Tax=Idiomarina sp. A28L TaxID=1036674 RepID=UPI00021389E2|nr:hypothetical protein [Idiomarina sp. A28L]EGN74528.1 hypothetical protein A28LD_2022 [Idiomarina sp. A28L]